MNTADAKRILEGILLCAQQPLAPHELIVLFNGSLTAASLRSNLESIQREWLGRSLELVHVASGWRFQSQPEICKYLDRLLADKPLRCSRASLETLAVIAHRQPVSRGDMEKIRGVTTAGQVLKQLEDRGWIKIIGHRETIDRPALYVTTHQFLEDFGMNSLDGLLDKNDANI